MSRRDDYHAADDLAATSAMAHSTAGDQQQQQQQPLFVADLMPNPSTTSADTGVAAAGGDGGGAEPNAVDSDDMDGGSLNNNAAAAVDNIDFDHDPAIANLPRILLMGPRRGGKTSLQRVVFQKMSPHETLFRLEATQRLERWLVDHTPLCRFTIYDFPGDYYGSVDGGAGGTSYDANNQYNLMGGGSHETDVASNSNSNSNTSLETMNATDVFLGNANSNTSLIFVVDAQDEPYDHVLQSFTTAVTQAIRVNPNIAIEVFINKVDGELFLSDESKYDCRRDIARQVSDELHDLAADTATGINPDNIQIRYHLTSIYDHSIYEALSRVVQRLIPQLPTFLENLLNALVSTCSMEKAYLFDVVSKLYISTDSGPVDMQSVELCSDMIDVVLDVSGIYGLGPSHQDHYEQQMLQAGGGGGGGESKSDDPDKQQQAAQSSSAMTTAAAPVATNNNDSGDQQDETLVDPDSAYDDESASVIRLSNGMVLYLKEVDTMLALVCITRAEHFRKKALINYNITCLKKALQALCVANADATV